MERKFIQGDGANPILDHLNSWPAMAQETIFYCLFAGFFFILAYVIISGCMLISIPRIGITTYLRSIKRVFLFLLILFGYGALGNLVWVFSFYKRFYVSGDPVTDFIPIVPFGWWAIDVSMGGGAPKQRPDVAFAVDMAWGGLGRLVSNYRNVLYATAIRPTMTYHPWGCFRVSSNCTWWQIEKAANKQRPPDGRVYLEFTIAPREACPPGAIRAT